MSKNKFNPNYALKAGVYLKEVIESRSISQAQLSRDSGLSPKVISQLITGDARFTAEFSLALEKSLNIDAELWMKLETRHQLFVARNKIAAE